VEAKERMITLSLSLPSSDLPIITVARRPNSASVWNLIYNALKFTSEEGRVVLRANVPTRMPSTLRCPTPASGFLPKPRPDFRKVFSDHSGGSKGSRGLGLGLAICKEIVLAHRGRIRAQSPGWDKGLR